MDFEKNDDKDRGVLNGVAVGLGGAGSGRRVEKLPRRGRDPPGLELPDPVSHAAELDDADARNEAGGAYEGRVGGVRIGEEQYRLRQPRKALFGRVADRGDVAPGPGVAGRDTVDEESDVDPRRLAGRPRVEARCCTSAT
jgi:hypothetical protein